jgi:hypothetical protein
MILLPFCRPRWKSSSPAHSKERFICLDSPVCRASHECPAVATAARFACAADAQERCLAMHQATCFPLTLLGCRGRHNCARRPVWRRHTSPSLCQFSAPCTCPPLGKYEPSRPVVALLAWIYILSSVFSCCMAW